MEASTKDLAATLGDLAPSHATCPIYSTVLARRADGLDFDGGIGDNLRQPVRFAQTVSQMLADGHTIFVELGPHPVLLPSIQQTASAESNVVTTIAVARKEEAECAAIQGAFGAFWATGYPIDWHKVMPEGGCVVDLPLYPWQRERHWVAQADMWRAAAGAKTAAIRPDDESLGWLHRLVWENSSWPAADDVPGRWLVLAGDRGMGNAVVSAFAAAGASAELGSVEALEATFEKQRAEHDGCCAGSSCSPPRVPRRRTCRCERYRRCSSRRGTRGRDSGL